MTEFLNTGIIEWVFAALLTVGVALLRSWVAQQVKTSQNKEIVAFVEASVKAAEQTLISNPGKLNQALRQVITYAKQHKIDLDEAQLRTLIEAAVLELKESRRVLGLVAETENGTEPGIGVQLDPVPLSVAEIPKPTS